MVYEANDETISAHALEHAVPLDASTVHRIHDAINRNRKEQQKFVLLAYAAGQHETRGGASAHDTFVALLNTDLHLALTFAEIANQSTNAEKRCRLQSNARKAHDAVVSFGKRLRLTEEEAFLLNKNLTRLRTALVLLGELF